MPPHGTITPYPCRPSPGVHSYQVPVYTQTVPLRSTDIPPSQTRTSLQAGLQKPPKAYTTSEMKENETGAAPHRTSAQWKNPHLQNVPRIHQGTPVRKGVSLRRTNSMDSVSVYSAASAPVDAHERIFQPMALEPMPSSAPTSATTYPNVPQPQPGQTGKQLSSRGSSTQIREELAPETYVKHQSRYKPLPPQPPSSIPPVPPVPDHVKVPRLPSVDLRINPHTSPSRFSGALPKLTVNAPPSIYHTMQFNRQSIVAPSLPNTYQRAS